MALITISPKAFFFDFDGVIVDSEKIHMAAARQMSKSAGIDFSEKYYFDVLLGFDDVGLFERLWQDNGRKLSADERRQLITGKNQAFLELVKSQVVYFQGVMDFIARLHERNIPLAIVSGALRSEIDACLVPANLDSRFRFIVSADDCQNSKPDPEPYRQAVARMQSFIPGLLPENCWAIEDSPAGVESARDAGIQVIGITHSVAAGELQEAHAVVKSFEEIEIQILAA